ncbi:hypothetical protein B0T22DRAFT_405468 [Podospora appendiculata]|uniref:SH3 domain-containing protein n=1 Tax=Podospora appendiculata TaxID=314037 RepID=A0AAE0X7Y8_9PEZI|nr:hypothetical protein B0T22DRAFT_405468 [Podospora appendiculata]
MDDELKDLVLGPFQDVVAKAKTALKNAQDADSKPMQKAAQSLVNIGERALKRIEPVCRRQLDEYGPNFVDALKENDEISSFRGKINGLAWDLEDCIEVDSFDGDIYSSLQGLLRDAALKISDLVVRMKLEHPPIEPEYSIASGTSRAPSVAAWNQTPETPQTLPQTPEQDYRHVSTSSVGSTMEAKAGPIRSWEDREAEEQGRAASESHSAQPPAPAPQRSADSVRPEDMPAEPSENPWQTTRDLPHDINNEELVEELERRLQISSAEDDHDTQPAPSTTPSSDKGRPVSYRPGSVDFASTSSNRARDSLISPMSADPRNSLMFNTEQCPVVERRDSFRSMMEQSQSLPNALSISRPALQGNPPPYQPRLPPVPQESSELFDQPGLEVVPQMEIADGLEVVSSETGTAETAPASPSFNMPLREHVCTIDLNSSFYLHKGFCEGAQMVMRGELGVRQIKKQSMGTGVSVIAKCRSCMYELSWESVDADLKQQSSANYRIGGIGFRLRFLLKSHLAAKRIDDELYACLFCIQQGQTNDESDATVFFTHPQLFSHLARHPRPLPNVPGLTVIETPQIPEVFKNNYDLHFPSAPTPSLMTESLRRETRGMPTAIATESFRQTHGTLRAPLQGVTMLQFAVGARIVGVEFPEKYGGLWGVGWADNVKAAFPMDCVRIVPPPKSEIKVQPLSNISATARWKRSPSSKENSGDANDSSNHWLKFDKGEVITSISFQYPEHWCWSGCNSRGKWGIFPQAFMQPNTMKELSIEPASLQSRNSWGSQAPLESKGRGVGSVFSRISNRRKASASEHRRSPAGSFVSGNSIEAATVKQRSPRPSLY